MATPIALRALTPDERTNLIYTHARDALARQLWQAAIGSGDAGGAPAPAEVGKLSVEGLMSLLAPAIPAPALPSPPAPSPEAVPLREIGRLGALGPNQQFASNLTSAARRTGIPPAAIAAIVNAESAKDASGAWRTSSRNPRSSAAGLGQFLSGTWRGMAEMKGTWLNQLAHANGWLDAGGKVLASARSALLALRYDAEASINTVADYAAHNLDVLRKRGVAIGEGIEAIARTAYLGHYLGVGDAVRYLRDELSPDRARALLAAQIGADRAARRIAEAGGAIAAHRDWFVGHARRALRIDQFVG